MSTNGIVVPAAENPICPICGKPLPAEGTPLTDITCPACGNTVMVPGMLGHYRMIRCLGQGGMGIVYEGFDEGLSRPVAIKFILREKVEEDPTFRESFRLESQNISKVNSTHVVQTYVNGEHDGQPYLVMELVKADALDRMMEKGPVAPVTALNVGIQIAEGLSAAYTRGMVHGDVKPENILIDSERNAKLADFGIAAAAGAQAAKNNEVWGTPYYIAPETLRKQKVEARADIFSLGCTLYHAMTGIPPFDGEDPAAVMRARLEGEAVPIQRYIPNCPEAIAKVITRMIETDPIRRYPNYEALINDMKRAQPKAGSLAGKNIKLKPKNASSVTSEVSRPMATVPQSKAEAFADFGDPEEEAKAAFKKKLMIFGGIGGGVFVAIVAIVLLVALGGGEDEAVTEAAAEETTDAVVETVDPRIALRQEIAALSESVAKEETTFATFAKSGEELVQRMAKRAERATLPEEQHWLAPVAGSTEAPAEGGEAAPESEAAPANEAPTAMLRELQASFKQRDALVAAADAAKKLRNSIDGLRVQAEEVEATEEAVTGFLASAKQLLETFKASPEATQAKAALRELEGRAERWNRTVDAARSEMEARVKTRLEAEKKALAEQKKKEEEERKKAEIEREVASVNEMLLTTNEPLNTFNTAEAVALFKSKTRSLKSAEAKAAAATALKRLTLFDDFRKWIISAANKGTFSELKVSAADAKKGITVNGKQIPWGSFAVDQNVLAYRMINGYIRDERGARSLSASERARMSLASLLFIERFVSGDLISKSPAMQATLKRLGDLAEGIPATAEMKKLFLAENAFPEYSAPEGKPSEEAAPAEETPAPTEEAADESADESGDDAWGWDE